MDLFTTNENPLLKPLAEQMRPTSFEDFIGQKRAIGQDTPIMRMIEQGSLSNLIIWGPPGTGKTSFALLLSKKLNFNFILTNAIDTGAKKIRELGQEAKNSKLIMGKQTVLFIDEIHRLNKSQQDVLLPFTEKGDLILIGATTENPSYEINSALLSRSKLLVFDRLLANDLIQLIQSTFIKLNLILDQILTEDVINALVSDANGDARNLFNNLEQIIKLYSGSDQKNWCWPLAEKEYLEFFSSPSFYYDKTGDNHYDTISAFIKSIRGSDPDAAIYYLARMVIGGEDPVFIARRLVILASEDVGNADPKALQLAISGMEAVKAIGLPEAGICLAQVTTYLASAPKSNRSYMAFNAAMAEVKSSGNLEVPKSLRSAQKKMAKDIGYGKGYKYSHDGQKGWIKQNFMPESLKETVFYKPSDIGFEKNIKAYLEWLKS